MTCQLSHLISPDWIELLCKQKTSLKAETPHQQARVERGCSEVLGEHHKKTYRAAGFTVSVSQRLKAVLETKNFLQNIMNLFDPIYLANYFGTHALGNVLKELY